VLKLEKEGGGILESGALFLLFSKNLLSREGAAVLVEVKRRGSKRRGKLNYE